MSAVAVTERSRELSPRFMGRMVLAGYLVLVLAGFDLFYVLRKMVVRGDAPATAANLRAHEGLFLAGFAVAFLGVAAYLVVTAFLYRLFEPVERTLSLTAAVFSLTGCVIQAVALTFHLVPLVVLGDHVSLAQMNPLVFFGLYCLLIGYLVFRSTFLPKILGVLMAFGGLGWLTFLFPSIASSLSPYNMAPGILGEGALTLWLLAKGVNDQRWQEQAASLRER